MLRTSRFSKLIRKDDFSVQNSNFLNCLGINKDLSYQHSISQQFYFFFFLIEILSFSILVYIKTNKEKK